MKTIYEKTPINVFDISGHSQGYRFIDEIHHGGTLITNELTVKALLPSDNKVAIYDLSILQSLSANEKEEVKSALRKGTIPHAFVQRSEELGRRTIPNFMPISDLYRAGSVIFTPGWEALCTSAFPDVGICYQAADSQGFVNRLQISTNHSNLRAGEKLSWDDAYRMVVDEKRNIRYSYQLIDPEKKLEYLIFWRMSPCAQKDMLAGNIGKSYDPILRDMIIPNAESLYSALHNGQSTGNGHEIPGTSRFARRFKLSPIA